MAVSGLNESPVSSQRAAAVTFGVGEGRSASFYMRQFNSYHSGFATEAKDGISLAPAWQIARKNKAVLAITGDNITQQDKERKGVILRQGRVYLDGKAASFCALKDDLTMEIFNGGERNAEELLEEGIRETVSFGPWLVRDGKGNDQVQLSPVNRVNPRVGLGMIAPGHFLAIVCDGRQSNYSYGLTLEQFRDLFLEAGCVQAYNMDGGCSTGMPSTVMLAAPAVPIISADGPMPCCGAIPLWSPEWKTRFFIMETRNAD